MKRRKQRVILDITFREPVTAKEAQNEIAQLTGLLLEGKALHATANRGEGVLPRPPRGTEEGPSGADMSLYQQAALVIDFHDAESGSSPWKLRIGRENNADAVEVGLYWADKPLPTHMAIVPLAELRALLEVILADQIVA